ncbi:MAG: insulinase family protein [Tissierellia bacterium]|nr:insulinase family protein [Tissierellia bacterium]
MKNYRIIEEKYIDEVASNCTVYEHIKTKAQVLTLANDDENKAFGIGFRTPPTKGDGVAHIVEHCVLSGSRKYRTREPFMDLIKSSMQTFLNAMTYPDKTIYPVSSRNEKDFCNLMDVYLDAVFYPRMYEVEEIFLQEGWHYELTKKEDPIIYNGVVYNEMKGVYSSAESIVSDGITFNLHKDSSYGVDSGGDPQEIPNLSYEEFLNFHKKYYHPSNSYIYLYGNMDMEKTMKYIDQEYLCHFDYQKVDSEILLNEPFQEQKRAKITYSASKEEMGKHKDYLAYSWCIGHSDNKLDLFMRNFLSELLIDAVAAPLKRALLERDFGEDIYGEISSSKTLDLSIVVKNTNADKVEEFKEIVENTLRQVVQEGIDRDLLLATLSRFEFVFREGGGAQKAIIYYARALDSWLYGKSPLDALSFDDTIQFIHQEIENNFVEKYIEEKLLQNPYSLILEARPELNKNEKIQKTVEEKLQKLKDSLTEVEIEQLIEKNQQLIAFQMTEDDEEAKKTIPSLELSDISPKIPVYPMIEDRINGQIYLQNPQPTNSIIYYILSLNMDDLLQEEIEVLTLLTLLLGKVDTKNYSYDQLNNEIYKATGGIGFGPTLYVDHQDSSTFYPRLNIHMKALKDKTGRGFELLEEIVHRSLLDQKKRVREVLLEIKSNMESSFLQNGHRIISSVTRSYFSPVADYQQKISGFGIYFYLKDLMTDFDNRWEEFSAQLHHVYGKVFHQGGMIINGTGDEKDLKDLKPVVEKFVTTLPNEDRKKAEYVFEENAKNQGFYTTSNVQYVSKGYSLKKLGHEFHGALAVLANILNSAYLHYEIRAKGGAYGAGISFNRAGDMVTYSYRDPNLDRTIEVYDQLPEFLENLELSQEDLTNFIIGSMNTFDPLLSDPAKGELNLTRYITGLTEEEMEQSKKEAMETDLEQLRAYAPVLKQAMDKNFMAVLGNEKKIRDSKDLFKEIISLK